MFMKCKNFYSIASLLLCIFIMFSLFAFAGCDSDKDSNDDVVENDEEKQELEETEELKSVIRVKKGILSGKRISGENLELVSVPVSSIPEGAIDSLEKIVGKYATEDMVLGEYVFERMLSSEEPYVDNSNVTYVVVSDEIENSTKKDITADLQALINAHPGRTIYFNDGTYIISSTIYLPTDEEKAVSLRFSNHAILKASDVWNSESAMIAFGAKTEVTNASIAANSIMGGKLDGIGKAKIGLSIENCKNMFVSNVTFENITTSISIKETADTVNVEGVTVKGNGAADSIGILNASSKGVFSTINMSNVNIGVKNSGTYNNFRTVYVKCLNASAESVGFYEAGGDNVYELCSAEDFACGYFIKDSLKNVFEACNSSWTRADVTTQNAFVAEGAFNSLITASAAKFFDSTSENAYIKFDIVGSGIVKVPIFEESLCDDDAYKTVLAGTVVFAK